MKCWKANAGLVVKDKAVGMFVMLDGLGKSRQAEFESKLNSFERRNLLRDWASAESDKCAALWISRFRVDQIGRNTDLQHGGAVVLGEAEQQLEVAAEVIG